jgi:CRP-like cAMP-binding protein
MTSTFGEMLPRDGTNAIYRALVASSRTALEGRFSEIELAAQKLLSAEEEGFDGLYFPISCVICRLVTMPEGTSVKVSVVGREGMVGTPALFGSSTSTFRTVVQIPGQALVLPKSEMQRLLAVPGTEQILFRYTLLLLREASLTAACNRSHLARQRLARWLLLIRDRADRDEFALTHESLSAMLGVRREKVSVAANELRRLGAIEYRRATVAVTNRSELVKQSCSCYAAITGAYARFLQTDLAGLT